MCPADDSIIEINEQGYEVRYFEWNKTIFKVISTSCTLTDTKVLMSAIISQAVKDFERLANPSSRKKKADIEYWETAKGFLFDDNYLIQYGDLELNFAEMLNSIAEESGFCIFSLRRSLIKKTTGFWVW